MRYLQPIFVLLCLLLLTGVYAQEALPPVEFISGHRQLTSTIDKDTEASFLFTEPSFNGRYYSWVQFVEIPSAEDRVSLEERGIEFTEYIHKNCYLLAIPQDISVAALYEAGARAAEALQLQDKVDPRILAETIPNENRVNGGITLKLMVHPGVHRASLSSEWQSAKATNVDLPPHDRFIIATIPQDQINSLSTHPAIRYIELMDPKGEPESVEGMSIQRGNLLNNQLTGGLSYDGDGVGILVRDDGDVGPHIDFAGRLTNDVGNSATGNHGDGVAGVWAANGNLDPTIVAHASAADVYVIDYLSTFLDNTLDYHTNSGVMVTNSSYSNGCNVGYTTTTVTVDEMMHDNLSFLHVFSAGNSNGNDCGYGAGSQWGNVTGGHKQGKNVLTVANLFRDGGLVGSSSRGPAHDGRIKPDIAGHGQGQMSTYENNRYQSFGGTSAAAPSTAGNVTQLYDAYRDLNGGANPEAALIKACVLNSAQDYGNPGPDFKYGWGLIHAGRAYEILEQNQYLSASVGNSGSNTHSITVPAGVGQLRIMVYWNDPEASANATTALINDIDMVVRDPSNTPNLPYLLNSTPDPALLDLPAGNGVDRLNNMEQVAITSPAPGTYNVDITGFNIPQGPQAYFLVYSFIPTGIDLTYPIGNEKLVPGVVERIHWDAFGQSGTFDVEYSTNNGSTWNAISTGVPADALGVDWLVPDSTSGDCLVRITRGGETDVSTETFSIHPVPEFCVAEVSATQATISWDAIPGATEYDVYTLQGETMQVIASTANTTYTATGLTAGTSYWYSVAAKTNTIEGQRAVAYEYKTGLTGDCGGCTATLTVPYSESFESGFGDYCNPTCGDYFDWVIRTGGTPSSGTGPSGASDGTQYIYIETSSPNNPSRAAHLLSPCIDLSGCTDMQMSFDYHMFGTSMGSLVLEVQETNATAWTELFSLSGNQGDNWNTANISLNSYCGSTVRFRFRAISGGGFTSDIAIDRIDVSPAAGCVTTFPWIENFDGYSECTPTPGPQTCNFGGDWTQDNNDGNDWRINAGTTASIETGPDNDNTTGSTNYAYIEASNVFNLTSNMWTPCLNLTAVSNPELHFHYHMYGADMGTLNVHISTDLTNWDSLWSKSGQEQTATDDPFTHVSVSLNDYTDEVVYIRFQGIAGASYNSDMAIDDVMVIDGNACVPITSPSISDVTDVSALVSWQAFPIYEAVEIELVDNSAGETPQGVADFSSTGSNYLLNGLTDGNEYAVYIRGICTSSSTAWSGPYSFSTYCTGFVGSTFAAPIVATMPYDEMHNTDTICLQNDFTNRPAKDMYFQFVPRTDTVTLSTCMAETTFDTYIALLNSAGTVLAINDDFECGFTLNGLNRFSTISYNVTANETYYLVVDGYFVSSVGEVRVTINDHNDCVSELTISSPPASGTYEAGNKILSNTTITSPNQVIFGAPEVDLQPNFEVQLGAELTTTSAGCN